MSEETRVLIQLFSLSVMWGLYCRYLACRTARGFNWRDLCDLAAFGAFSFLLLARGHRLSENPTLLLIVAVVGFVACLAALMHGRFFRDTLLAPVRLWLGKREPG